MITPMLKVQIIGLKTDKKDLISLLHKLGIMHIEVTPLSMILQQRGMKHISLDEGEDKERKILGEIIKKTKEILSRLKTTCLEDIGKFYGELEKVSSTGIQTRITDIDSQLNSITQEKNRLKDESLILPQYKKIMEPFLKVRYDLSQYKDFECIVLIFPKRYKKQMKFFQERIEAKIKHKIDIYLSDFDAKREVSLVFYDKRFTKDIDEEIFKRGTQKVVLPQQYLGTSFEESVELIEVRQKEIQEHLISSDKQIEQIAKENFCFLYAVKAVSCDRLNELIVQEKLVETKYTITVTGWIPEERLIEIRSFLEKEFGNRIIIKDITKSVKKREEIPVLLDNPAEIKPFELLLSILEPPKYGSLDPTRFLAIFFPLFFGLIVGDTGYGLVLLLVSLWLRQLRQPIVKSISKLVSYVAVSSIAFGILFAEFFGDLPTKIFGIHPILFHRQKDIVAFFVLAVSIGIVHILLGLILGIIEAIKQKHKKEALEKGSLILSLFGLFLLVAALSKILPKGFFVFSAALLTISLSVLIRIRGIIGPLEILSVSANILSYARIMALGIAGVMLAHIANTFGGLIQSVILGTIVASLIHILNLILSIFSPTIQSLRLHYVEFFSKFYEAGGKRYIPFRKAGDVECIH